jgi:hypothetical protein
MLYKHSPYPLVLTFLLNLVLLIVVVTLKARVQYPDGRFKTLCLEKKLCLLIYYGFLARRCVVFHTQKLFSKFQLYLVVFGNEDLHFDLIRQLYFDRYQSVHILTSREAETHL